jgi:hypothetical protein
MENQKIIQVASINHRLGVTILASTTIDGLYDLIAKHCSNYPEDSGDPAAYEEAISSGDSRKIVESYFNNHPNEFLDIQESVLLGE